MTLEEENINGTEKEEKIISPRRTNVELKRLLVLRDAQKKRQPPFTRLESWRYKKLKPVWRKPKGIDNHMRLKKKGWPKSVTVGYRSPKQIRGLHPSGFDDILVYNIKDLDEIQSHQAIRISQTVGRRKRAEIVAKAQKLAIHVLNKRMDSDETF
jgi:large subunit ribosomal protein L32e